MDKLWNNNQCIKCYSRFLKQRKIFDTPKPVELIKHILKLATKDDAIILDSLQEVVQQGMQFGNE